MTMEKFNLEISHGLSCTTIKKWRKERLKQLCLRLFEQIVERPEDMTKND